VLKTHEKETLLAGDIGGTKTLLGLFSLREGRITFLEKKRFSSREYLSLSDIIDDFLRECDVPVRGTSASFAIAGPCENGICKTRNLPWVVSAEKIRRRFKLDRVSLINDFEAVIYGIPYLAEKDLMNLNPGERNPVGNIAVLGAGTGLGEGFAVFEPSREAYRIYPSEGGHADFSPNDDEEIALLRFLRKEFGHVSFERVLSGPGLVNIYRFLVSTGDYEVSRTIEEEIRRIQNPASVITRFGLNGDSEICSRSLDLFVSIYGMESGNLALKILPTGGLYLAGGIAEKMRKRLADGRFLRSFLNKGRSSGLLKRIPVFVILNSDVGLIGAAVKALG